MKKSVIIEGQKSRSSIRNGKSFNRMDQKSQLQIKKIIQASKTSERLDLSERNILSLNSQIADLNETLKGKLVRPIPFVLNFNSVLHLQKNRIQNLPSELGCLRLLELLVLNENNLTSLPDSLGSLKKNVDGSMTYLLHLSNTSIST